MQAGGQSVLILYPPVAFLVIYLFDSGPGHLVGRFLPPRIAPTIFRIAVFIPGGVERLAIDLLSLGRQVVAHTVRQV